MNRNFDEIILNCVTSVNALMTSNEVAKDDKAVIKLNRFKKWLNDFAAAMVTQKLAVIQVTMTVNSKTTEV